MMISYFFKAATHKDSAAYAQTVFSSDQVFTYPSGLPYCTMHYPGALLQNSIIIYSSFISTEDKLKK